MGGYGSGRRVGWTRPIVEDAKVLDVDRLVRLELIAPGLYRSGPLALYDLDTGEESGSVGFVSDATEGRSRCPILGRTGTDYGAVRLVSQIQCTARFEWSHDARKQVS